MYNFTLLWKIKWFIHAAYFGCNQFHETLSEATSFYFNYKKTFITFLNPHFVSPLCKNTLLC